VRGGKVQDKEVVWWRKARMKGKEVEKDEAKEQGSCRKLGRERREKNWPQEMIR
jgi:hypothetical protein